MTSLAASLDMVRLEADMWSKLYTEPGGGLGNLAQQMGGMSGT